MIDLPSLAATIRRRLRAGAGSQPPPPAGSTPALSYVVPIYFNQQRTDTLPALLARYAAYGPELTAAIEFVLVDDGSPLPVVLPPELNLNISLYRVCTDITWNQCGARNLGATLARGPRLILSDLDHYFPEELLRAILGSPVPRGVVYKFKRADHQGRPINKAMNIFYTSKGVFFQALGYDEEFCGNYGYEDLHFLALQRRIGNPIRYFTRWKRIVATNVDRGEAYHSLVRDTSVNYALYLHKKALLEEADPYLSHSRSFLRFPWEVVAERRQQPG